RRATAGAPACWAPRCRRSARQSPSESALQPVERESRSYVLALQEQGGNPQISAVRGRLPVDLGAGRTVLGAVRLPSEEDDRDHGEEDEPAGYPHDQPAQQLIIEGRQADDARRGGVGGIQQRA